MSATASTASLWTDEQEELIENACRYALMSFDTWGPMHLMTLTRVLEDQGHRVKVSNSRGTANVSGIAVWRLARDKRIKAVSGKPITLKEGARTSEEDSVAVRRVFSVLTDFGGIATLENLQHPLSLDGYGKDSIANAVGELVKTNRARYPFFLSPNRRIWVPKK